MMTRLSPFLVVVALAGLGCDPPPVEGEGDSGGGEGEAAEGEGDVAEGEGDVVVGEGEGDVVVGEGEGDVVAGEGEGDVVAGEGEGEGEGDVGPVIEAGEQDDPTDVAALPFSATVAIIPEEEHDCFRFTLATAQLVTVSATTPDCEADPDPEVSVFDDAGFEVLNDDDGGTGVCSVGVEFLDAGTYVACVGGTTFLSFRVEIPAVTIAISAADPIILTEGADCSVFTPEDGICDPTETGGTTLDCVSGVCTIVTVIEENQPCDRTDDTQRCSGTLLCLDVATDVSQCVTRAAPGVAGDACVDSFSTAFPCADGLECLAEVCVDPIAQGCDVLPVDALVGTTAGSITAADADFLDGSCSSTSRPEQSFFYVVTGAGSAAAHVQVAANGTGVRALYVLTDCAAGTEVGCQTGTNSSFIETEPLAAGTVLTFVVEGDLNTNFTLTVVEAPVDIVGVGDACDVAPPLPPTAERLCDTGLACSAGTCIDPLVLRCDAATTLVAGPNDVTLVQDGISGVDCGPGGPGSELIGAYTMTGTGVLRVSASGVDVVLSARSAPCDSPDSDLGVCSDSQTDLELGLHNAGDVVFIVVDGFSTFSSGDLTLTIEELPLLAVGDACQTNADTGVCPDGSRCTNSICTEIVQSCLTATRVTSGVAASATTTGGANNYGLGRSGDSCTGFSTDGPEAVFVIDVPAGAALDVVMTPNPSFDAALWLADSCPIISISQCLDGSDSGNPETVSLRNAPGGDIYIVADSFSTTGGSFQIVATVTP